MDHAEEYRLWAERLKAKMDHAEYRLEQLRRKRGHLVGSEHEDLYRRTRKGEGIISSPGRRWRRSTRACLPSTCSGSSKN